MNALAIALVIAAFIAGYLCGFFSWPQFLYTGMAKLTDKIKGSQPDENITGGN